MARPPLIQTLGMIAVHHLLTVSFEARADDPEELFLMG